MRFALSSSAAVAFALLVFSAVIVAEIAAAEKAERDQRIAQGQDPGGEDDLADDVRRVLEAMAFSAPLAIGGAAALGLLLARAGRDSS